MKKISGTDRRLEQHSGAALPAVLLITFLLLTASIAMLTAAGANSRNASDVLAETKAYYSAESGIQAAVNVLRNGGINYKDAVNNDGGTLEDWLVPNWTSPDGTNGLSIGTETGNGFSVRVSDPDNSQTQISFRTDTAGLNAGFSKNGLQHFETVSFPNDTDANRTIISWEANTDNPMTKVFGGDTSVTAPLGKFVVTNVGNGAPIDSKVYFRINLRLAAPDNPTWVIKGSIDPVAASTNHAIKFISYGYRMVGSDIWLCATDATCPTTAPTTFAKVLALPPADSSIATSAGVRLTPKEPQRLVLRSVGYGPNRARKELEAIIQKTFFPAVPPAAGLLMNGPAAGFSFVNGNGKPQYRGCDPYNPSVCVPSIGVTDPANLAYMSGVNFDPSPHQPGVPNPDPPPALVGEDLPEWQRSPEAMDEMINLWRIAAVNGNKVFAPNTSLRGGQFGSFETGLGLTFCDGNCTISGDGGGVLIVKGKLTTTGGVNFKGMVVVVGTDGLLRNGNGGPDDQIIGSMIVSPYTLTPTPRWLAPKFQVNGGGSSVVTYSGLDYLFDGGITGASNFVSGVVEK